MFESWDELVGHPNWMGSTTGLRTDRAALQKL